MRLWHEKLLPLLPRQQLLGQHRECCALRGNGWGRPHATVNYVFDHPYEWLWVYHMRVVKEILNRGYQINSSWLMVQYRGKYAPQVVYKPDCSETADPLDWFPIGPFKAPPDVPGINRKLNSLDPIYPEHNDEYLKECLDNLARKGIHLEVTV